ncbi:MAG: VCBS repeat-containing protein [bacterium]|nr:VCBS repeat-containing protein [bacterium]
MNFRTLVLPLIIVLAFFSVTFLGCDGSEPELFEGKYVVDASLKGAAFSRIEDVNGDGFNDIVVSSFGSKPLLKGSVVIYYNKGNNIYDADNWDKQYLFDTGENVCFPNKVEVADVDSDGDKDIFVPSGFLACDANPLSSGKWGLVWFEQTGSNWQRHDIVPYGSKINGSDKLFFHRAELADIDEDGINDLITTGEIKSTGGTEYAETYWFKGNTSPERFETTPRFISSGGGSLPDTFDVDNDGDLDIVSAQYFAYNEDNASFIWFEQKSLSNWEKHIINREDAGPSIQLSLIPDLLGDGTTRLVGANHTNSTSNPSWPHEAMYLYSIPADTSSYWPGSIISDEFQSRENPSMGVHGAPGIFDWGDVDGDGDIDIAVSGDGDARIFVLEQAAPGEFETKVIDDGNVGQAGVAVGDLNNDGTDEIIVSTFDGGHVLLYNYNEL